MRLRPESANVMGMTFPSGLRQVSSGRGGWAAEGPFRREVVPCGGGAWAAMVLPYHVGGAHGTELALQYHGDWAWIAGIERGGVPVDAAPKARGPDDPGAASGSVGRPAPDRSSARCRESHHVVPARTRWGGSRTYRGRWHHPSPVIGVIVEPLHPLRPRTGMLVLTVTVQSSRLALALTGASRGVACHPEMEGYSSGVESDWNQAVLASRARLRHRHRRASE